MKDLKITINGVTYDLKITLGFWKRCGFKREDAQIISADQEKYTQALKLAIFYGNKEKFEWNSIKEMEKTITNDVLDELDEDFSEKLSMAMVHYLPQDLRKIILKKMSDAKKGLEEVIDETLKDEKKN